MPFKLRGVGWNTTCRPGKSPFSLSFPCSVPFRHSRPVDHTGKAPERNSSMNRRTLNGNVGSPFR